MKSKSIKSTPNIDWLANYIGKSYDWVASYKTNRVTKSDRSNDLISDATRHYNLIWECVDRMLQTRSKKELIELFKALIKEL